MGKPKEKRGPKTGKRRCVFCGGDRIDSEHVFPKWLTRLTDEVLKLRGESHHPWLIVRAQKQRKAFSLDMTAKWVCEDCNSGWMSDLESKAEPIPTPMILGYEEPHDMI